jgi:hypothetical protein
MNNVKSSLRILICLFVLLLSFLQLRADDPGNPGGDPDLPETPIDGALWILIVLLIIYGVKKLNAPLS